jgi:hypothetical protein
VRGWERIRLAAVGAVVGTVGLPIVPLVDAPAAAASCDRTWVRGAGTFGDADWKADTSWEPQRAPTTAEVACFPAARVEFFLLNATVGAVEVPAGGTLWLWGTTLDLNLPSSVGGILLANGSVVRGSAELTIPKGSSAGTDTSQTGTFATTGSSRLVVDGQLYSPSGGGLAVNLDVLNRGTVLLDANLAVGPGRKLLNEGIIRMRSRGTLQSDITAALVNEPTGTIEVETVFAAGGADAVGIRFGSVTNAGAITVGAGDLALQGTVTSTGTWQLGTTGATSCTMPSAKATDETRVFLRGPASFTAGSVTGPGCLELMGDTLVADGVEMAPGTLSIWGYVATVHGDRALPRVLFSSGGKLAVSGTVTVPSGIGQHPNQFYRLGGTGTLIVPPGVPVAHTGNSLYVEDDLDLVMGGPFTIDGNDFTVRDTASFISEGTWTLRGNAFLQADAGAEMVNEGTLLADPGAGKTVFLGGARGIDNRGTFRLASGSIDMRAPFLQMSGSHLLGGRIEVAAGTTWIFWPVVTRLSGQLRLEGDANVIDSFTGTNSALRDLAEITGRGRLELADGADLDLRAGTANGLLNGGAVALDVGSDLIATSYEQTFNATLGVEMGATGTGRVTTGSASLAGFLEISPESPDQPALKEVVVIDTTLVSGQFVSVSAIDGGAVSVDQRGPVTVSYDPANAPIVVTNTNDSGPGSFRQALIDAENASGLDAISFAIPGAGPHRIAPNTALLELTGPVVIDATTQPGYDGTRPLVELYGSNLSSSGLTLRGPESQLRGLSITGWAVIGVRVLADDVRVENSWIGVTPSGVAVPNGSAGLSGNGHRATIGGNLVSGNSGTGILWNPASGVVITGNRIGTTPDGSGNLGNTDHGILLLGNGASTFTVGGPLPEDGNVILANGLSGLTAAASLSGTTVVGAIEVRHNVLGAPGRANGSRTSPTIDISRFDGAVVDNVVTDNPTRGGILLKGPSGNLTVRRNAVARNAGLGINLSANPNVIDNVTANDAGDVDAGVNGIQNFPVLTGATLQTTQTLVEGTLASKATTTYTIDVYANAACDTSGNGEAEKWLGSFNVTTDGSGRAGFSSSLPATSLTVLTATATGPEGTSELSACRTATVDTITFTADDATAGEGDGAAVVTVRASAPVPADTVVYLGLADGTATRDLDYAVRDETVTIPTGQTSVPATVSIIDDGIWEEAETFELLVLKQNPVSIADRATVTIVDNDPLPPVEIEAFNPYREDAGTISLPVRLARTAGSDVALQVQAWSGTAEIGEDFRLVDASVTIPAGATEALIRVEILQDTESYEADREFFGVTVAHEGQFLDLVEVEIEDDDDYVQARFVRQPGDDPEAPLRRWLVEGNTLDTTLILPVEVLGAAATETVTVELVVDSVDAERGVDFDVSPSTLVFEPGDGPKSFTIIGKADTVVEPNRHLLLALQTPQGDLLGRVDDEGVVTLVDDDSALTLTPSVTTPVAEAAGAAVLTITADPAPTQPVTVPVLIQAITATPGDDVGTAGLPPSITIPAGAPSASLDIPILDDGVAEGDEAFRIVLGSPNQGTLTLPFLDVTITDDDPAAVTIADVSVLEQAGQAVLTVRIDAPLPADLLLPYNFVPLSSTTPPVLPATYDVDYDARPGSVRIPAGQTSASFLVPIRDDVVHEADELFTTVVHLADGSSVRARVTIVDDDPEPGVNLQAFGPYAEDAGVVSLVLRLDRTAGVPLTYDVRAVPGIAESPEDYVLLTGSVTVPAGSTQAPPVWVSIVDDTLSYEGEREDFAVVVSRNGVDLDGVNIEIVNDDIGPHARFVRQPSDPPNLVLRRALVEGTTADVTLPLQVALLGDPITEPTTVEVTAGSLDAERFVDYDISPTTLTFQPGDGPKTVTVTILADSAVEPDEVVLLGLSTDFGNLLGRVDDGAEVTIVDDDGDTGTDPAVEAFRAGWTDLLGRLGSWLASFDLPAAQAPAVVTPSLASHFGLPDLELNLPTLDPGLDTLAQLIADLEGKGFTIDFADGGLLGHPAPPVIGDLLQARIQVNLPDLARAAGFTLDPYNDSTAGVLASLASSLGLDAAAGQGWLGALSVGLVVGVDGAGFYVDDDTRLALDVGGLVDLGGAGTVGGLPALPAGTALPDLVVELRPGALRQRDLDLPLLPSVSGFAEVLLRVGAGPFSFDWAGSWTMGIGGVTVEPPSLGGTLSLPGLETCDPLAPADLSVASELLADRWRVTAEGPVSECYLFGGFEAGDVSLTAEVGPEVLAGSGTLTLVAPAPGGDRALSLSASFDPSQLAVAGSLTLPTLDVGELDLTGVTIAASFSAALPGGPLSGGLTVTAASADLLDGTGTAADLSGTLTSGGTLTLTAATVEASIEGAIDLSLTDVTFSLGAGTGPDLLTVDARHRHVPEPRRPAGHLHRAVPHQGRYLRGVERGRGEPRAGAVHRPGRGAPLRRDRGDGGVPHPDRPLGLRGERGGPLRLLGLPNRRRLHPAHRAGWNGGDPGHARRGEPLHVLGGGGRPGCRRDPAHRPRPVHPRLRRAAGR